MYEAETQIIAYYFLGSARLGSDISRLRLNKNPARLGSTILRLSFCGSGFGLQVYKFLFAFYSNYGAILYRLRDIATFW